jgi:molybdate transport system substrate-binding protein
MRSVVSNLALAAAVMLLSGPASAQTRDVTVFAAASMTTALQEAGDVFAKSSGIKAKFSFAASSTLAKQIEAGAGAQVFISADEAWMDYLQKRGLIETASRKKLVGNRLVLVVSAARPFSVEIGAYRGWVGRLPAGRISTGDPAHVPVGRYAEEALKKLGAWAEVEPRLARADNVRNALVLVERGEAAAGIVFGTDAAVSKKVAVAGSFPETSHEPISYPVALLRGQAQGEALQFYEFLLGADAKSIFVKNGFSVP